MGKLAVIMSFTRTIINGVTASIVKLDPGGGPLVTAEHISDPGDDSYPVPGDYAVIDPQNKTGRYTVSGYIDPNLNPKSDTGEKRIYARDNNGEVAEVWLKNDGSIVVSNGSGNIELLANGNIDLNGVIIDTNGNMTVPISLKLNGKELDGHTHPILGGSSSPGPTGPNT